MKGFIIQIDVSQVEKPCQYKGIEINLFDCRVEALIG